MKAYWLLIIWKTALPMGEGLNCNFYVRDDLIFPSASITKSSVDCHNKAQDARNERQKLLDYCKITEEKFRDSYSCVEVTKP